MKMKFNKRQKNVLALFADSFVYVPLPGDLLGQLTKEQRIAISFMAVCVQFKVDAADVMDVVWTKINEN